MAQLDSELKALEATRKNFGFVCGLYIKVRLYLFLHYVAHETCRKINERTWNDIRLH